MAEAGKVHSPPLGRQKERPDQRLSVIGTRMLRKEDPRFLVGRGRFVDDIALPNMAHAAVLRSPHAHARIKSIDTAAAQALPGVLAVITGEEAAKQTGPLPCFANPPVEQRCIALGKVRHVGEPVVLVVADTRYLAEDAIELINVEYEPLPAVSDMIDAIPPTATIARSLWAPRREGGVAGVEGPRRVRTAGRASATCQMESSPDRLPRG